MALSACFRHRSALLYSSPSPSPSFSLLPTLSSLPRVAPPILLLRRSRHGGASKKLKTKQRDQPHKSWNNKYIQDPPVAKVPSCPSEEDIPSYFQSAAVKWAKDSATRRRLNTFGVPYDQTNTLLQWFAKAVENGQITSSPELISKYTLQRLLEPQDRRTLDIICSTVFFQYVSGLPESALSTGPVPSSTLVHLRQLAEAAERNFPAEEFNNARKIRRKIIMHVGPTNSGKTYHALRALAAAPRGVYAGPLRLLAHEIYDRLNKGMICPLGMDPDAPPPPTLHDALAEEESDSTALDLPPVRPHKGNPLWARECNMITGELTKKVSDDAQLISCTIEMLSYVLNFDVAVLDEIQMISDPQRGFAWTDALLGVVAKEVHVCGEETAVPLVQEILKNTGDELIVNRYQRLTPLTVENQSFQGQWKNVKKGDCVVTFSRSRIFAIKNEIEKETGMKCAIVYGKLPPEIRSEQAALFNDPDSGYDVMVGSDAIGMGLNLKIHRMVFDTVVKVFKGVSESLSVSQVKQIAGRAGRFGMGSENGGFVTTFQEKDLDFVRKTLAVDPVPLSYACLGVSTASFNRLATILPSDASTATVFDAHIYTGQTAPIFKYVEVPSLDKMSAIVDERASINGMTTVERLLFMNAPIPWRDEAFLESFDVLLNECRVHGMVDFNKAMERSKYPAILSSIENITPKDRKSVPHLLKDLEMYHKIAIFYMWMSQRNSVVWPHGEQVAQLKEKIELAMQKCLLTLSKKDSPSKGDSVKRED